MSDDQRALFNYRALSSARMVNRMRREKAALPYRRVPKVDNSKPEGEDIEFNLPDESREFDMRHLKRCPLCNDLTWHGPIMDKVFEDSRFTYDIRCANPNCSHRTGRHDSKTKAVQTWQVMAKMMRP